jgi:D-aminoacyl-tRNA deacylase
MGDTPRPRKDEFHESPFHLSNLRQEFAGKIQVVNGANTSYERGRDGVAVAKCMRVVIQRVSEASVTIRGTVNGKISAGLVVLAAFEETDTVEDLEWLSGKIVRLRIFDDESGVMNRSVQEIGGAILLVSQFTLFASTKKGNRPSYSHSARPEIAVPLYEKFIRRLETDFGRSIQTGEFGAHMVVSLNNDGPVTIIIDSKQRE